MELPPIALDELRLDTRERWGRKAAFWHDRTEAPNKFQRFLKGPATEHLLAVSPGEPVLDIACGSGVFARRLAELGAEVTAFDFAADFITRARDYAGPDARPIEYLVVDATDEADLRSLGERRFAAAVCGMALMDMPTVEPLAGALARVLRVGGRFVFSVCHPSFNHARATRAVELVEQPDGTSQPVPSLRLTGYTTPFEQKNAGIAGSPEPHLMFHRPLAQLLEPFFAAGFALDGLVEPTLPRDPSGTNHLSWSNYTEFPPVLVGRLRLIR